MTYPEAKTCCADHTLPMEACVLRPIDDTHSATAEFLKDAVVGHRMSSVTKLSLKVAQNELKGRKSKKTKILAILRLTKGFS
jgi:hypothetical protein